MATTTTNYGFDVPTSSDLVKNGATAISTLGQDIDTFLYRPFTVNGAINGGMDIWQRGTSFTATNGATSTYGPDRWNIYCGRAGLTISRQTASLTGFQYSMRVQRDSGNTATTDMVVTQPLETIESLKYAGQSVTLSYYARAGANFSATGSLLTGQVRSGTGTDQIIWNGYTGSNTFATSNVTLTTSWQRFSVTATAPSTATELTILFASAPTGTAGANDWFEITGVQLEVGNQVSPFTRAGGTIQGELAACQRYFQTLQWVPAVKAIATTDVQTSVQLSPMRTSPTAAVIGVLTITNDTTADYTQSSGNVVLQQFNANGIRFKMGNFTGLTVGNLYSFYNASTTTNAIQLSAEL